jgi:hypothetical protein
VKGKAPQNGQGSLGPRKPLDRYAVKLVDGRTVRCLSREFPTIARRLNERGATTPARPRVDPNTHLVLTLTDEKLSVHVPA